MRRKITLLAVLAAALLVAAPAIAATQHSGATKATTITVKATEFKFALSKTSAPKGTVNFKVTNKGKVDHDFKINGKKTKLLAPGKSADADGQVPENRKVPVPVHRPRPRGLGHEGHVHRQVKLRRLVVLGAAALTTAVVASVAALVATAGSSPVVAAPRIPPARPAVAVPQGALVLARQDGTPRAGAERPARRGAGAREGDGARPGGDRRRRPCGVGRRRARDGVRARLLCRVAAPRRSCRVALGTPARPRRPHVERILRPSARAGPSRPSRTLRRDRAHAQERELGRLPRPARERARARDHDDLAGRRPGSPGVHREQRHVRGRRRPVALGSRERTAARGCAHLRSASTSRRSRGARTCATSTCSTRRRPCEAGRSASRCSTRRRPPGTTCSSTPAPTTSARCRWSPPSHFMHDDYLGYGTAAPISPPTANGSGGTAAAPRCR